MYRALVLVPDKQIIPDRDNQSGGAGSTPDGVHLKSLHSQAQIQICNALIGYYTPHTNIEYLNTYTL